MPILQIDVTDQLMGKLNERAKESLVEASDVARGILSNGLAAKPMAWMETLNAIIHDLSKIVVGLSQIRNSPGSSESAMQ